MSPRLDRGHLLAGRRLYLCTADREDLEGFLGACIEGGVDVVQLRDKVLDDESILYRAATAQKLCAAYNVPFILNDRPDLAAQIGADGAHVGQTDGPPERARRLVGDHALLGLSTHSSDQLSAALREPVDYVSVGPVVTTPTKPGRSGTGLSYVTEASRQCADEMPSMPFFVTGDAQPDTVGAMVRAGATRFVAVRWLTGAANPRAAARELAEAIDTAVAEFGR